MTARLAIVDSVRGYFCSLCTRATDVSSEDVARGVTAFHCGCGEWNAIPFAQHPAHPELTANLT